MGRWGRGVRSQGEQHFARGRVSAIETFRDYHGTRTWVYVRWFDSDGKPDKDEMKHCPDELVECPTP